MFSAIAIAATAQDTVAVVRIGYIDKQLFINSMPEMQAVQADLQRLKGEYEAEFRSMTEMYNKRVKQYIAQKDDMSEAIMLARQTEITELETTLDLYKRRYLAELEQKRDLLTTPIYDAVNEAIGAVARRLGLTIVFDQGTPLYVSDACVDITDAVGEELK